MCARSASAGWLHLVEQVQEGTEKLKNIKLKKHISLKKKSVRCALQWCSWRDGYSKSCEEKEGNVWWGEKRLGKDLQRKYPQRSTVKRTHSVRVTCITRNKQFFSSLFLQQDWCVLSSSPLLVSCGCVLPGVLLPPGVSQ